jgi:hypothetical protein
MKNVFYTAILMLFVASSASAQISKGKVLLGGNVGFTQYKNETTNTTGYNYPSQTFLNISPSIGKVIRENLVLGVQAGIRTQKAKYLPQNTVSKNKYYDGGLFLRRYVPLLKSFYFFGHSAANFSAQKGSESYQDQMRSKTKGWSTSVSLYPGLAYAITRKFYVEAALNNLLVASYGRSETELKDPTSGSDFYKTSSFAISTSLGSNAGFAIGFRFLL